MLLTVLAGLRTWFVDRSWTVAAWAAVAAGLITGIAAGRLVMARLAFHGFDGLLAADALQPSTRRHYMAAWHGIGIVVLAAITLIVRPSLIVGVPAYLAGVLMAGPTDGLGMPRRIVGRTRPGWSIRAWLRRPTAGFAAAMFLLLALLPARTLGPNVLVVLAGVGTVLLALVLTIVDEGVVRFMTIAGHGSGRIMMRLSRALASFIAVAVPGCWLVLGPASAGISAAASTMMLLLLAMRVLAYRLHGKRFADLLVSILAGLLMLVAYASPVALPVVVIAALWQLQRRAAAKTWLLT